MFNIPQDVPFPSYSLILYLRFKKKKIFTLGKRKRGSHQCRIFLVSYYLDLAQPSCSQRGNATHTLRLAEQEKERESLRPLIRQ